MNVAKVGRYLVTKCGVRPWCYGRWFCIVMNPVWPFKSDIPLYVKNDGTASGRMQVDVLDGTGGTYFLTKEEAEEAAKRFNDHHASVKPPLDGKIPDLIIIDELHDVPTKEEQIKINRMLDKSSHLFVGSTHAAKDDTDQSDTKETTNKTKDIETKTIKRKVKRADT